MPTSHQEKLRWLALAWGAGLGPMSFRRVVGHLGSAKAVLEAGEATWRLPVLRLSEEQVAAMKGLGDRLDEFERELVELQGESIAVTCDWEDGYPSLLKDLRSAPPVVCMAGRFIAPDGHAVAIVGTRTPTEAGFAMARELGRAFAEQGVTVVSGLARGCDTAAHQGALEGGGRTVAVLGSGIRQIHPRKNLGLARTITRQGVVLSEAPPHAQPTVGRLMARNRLQSALARGVLVVQAREGGGSLEQARCAVEQRRRLYAVRWPAGLGEGAGTERLIGQGARAITGPQDVPEVCLELADHIARMASTRRAQDTQGTLF